jgi:tRNA threonylcarbamoyladenosine biosynthesis protein TsaE
MNPVTLHVPNLNATEAFGRQLAAYLFPGAVVALIGPLGAGKTHLTRAIAEGLGIADANVVNSPTFVLIQEYDARLPIYHFDAYRLQNETEFADLGVHEYFQGHGVSIVEWADKVPACLPRDRLEIRITITGEESRRLDMMAYGERYEGILSEFA